LRALLLSVSLNAWNSFMVKASLILRQPLQPLLPFSL